MLRAVLAIGLVAALLAGCGSRVVDRSDSATPAYDGELRAGATVAALECDGRTPFRRATGVYDGGLATVQDDAEAALDDYMREQGLSLTAPLEDFAVERESEHRTLFSYDVEGRTKMALLAADDVRDWNHDRGWGLREWAQCDPSELPAEVTEDLNIGVWEDASGRRVPVTRIQSFKGAEHCSWTHITFLLVGPERRGDWYVKDVRGEFAELLRGTFSARAGLPADALETGWRRHGRELWLDRQKRAAYLVSLEDSDDVQRWPAAKERIGCA